MSAVTTVGGPKSRSQVAATLAPLAGAALVLLIAAIATPSFYNAFNLRLILFQGGLIGVTAIGQTLVLLIGGIDLSIGAVIGLTTVIVASHTNGSNGPLPVAIVLAVLAGLAVGVVNAALVLLRDVPPFVATFATFVLVQGTITAATRGAPSGDIPPGLKPIGANRIAGVPVPLWIFAAIAIVAGIALAKTTIGRSLYATGANRRASALSGIRTHWYIGGAYVLSALLAVLAGLIDAGYVGHVDAQLSRSLNLDSVAAAVIGGIALTGGEGTVVQTIGGVALLAVLLVWLVQLGGGVGAQLTVEGVVILLAVWLQRRGGVGVRSRGGRGKNA